MLGQAERLQLVVMLGAAGCQIVVVSASEALTQTRARRRLLLKLGQPAAQRAAIATDRPERIGRQQVWQLFERRVVDQEEQQREARHQIVQALARAAQAHRPAYTLATLANAATFRSPCQVKPDAAASQLSVSLERLPGSSAAVAVPRQRQSS